MEPIPLKFEPIELKFEPIPLTFEPIELKFEPIPLTFEPPRLDGGSILESTRETGSRGGGLM